MRLVYFLVAFLALASSIASAYDPSPLQDICVAIDDPKTGGTHPYIISMARLVSLYVTSIHHVNNHYL